MNEERHVRVGENESAFRDVNERVQESHARWGGAAPQEFLCECGDPSCAERVHLTLEEYETLRSVPTRFAILSGHEISDVERVVQDHERFTVVEKAGRGGEIAEALDPRSRD